VEGVDWELGVMIRGLAALLLLPLWCVTAAAVDLGPLLQHARALATVPLYSEAHDAYRELLKALDDSAPGERDKLWGVEQEVLLWLGVTARRLGRNTEAIEWLQVR
jgi:hypothetical protein